MQRIFRPRVVGPWLAVVLVLGLGSSAFAQTGAASITGLLTDQSGAAVPGVTVTATNQATNVPYPAVSNNAGVRALLVHALHERAQRFYEHYGFQPSPTHSLTLMLRLSVS